MNENEIVQAPEQIEESSDEVIASPEQNPEVADAKQTLTDPSASKSEKKAAEKLLKKFEIKVDGKVETLELDLNNEEELKKHLQMSKAASKRMGEAAELRKSAEDFIDLLKKNPRKVLADPNIGVDLKKFVQEYLDEEIANSQKSPEQLEKEKLLKELDELKEKSKKDEESRKEREFKRLQAEQEEKIQENIQSALETGGVPKSPYTVRKMAEMMMLALENNIDVSPKDLVPALKKQMSQDLKEFFGATPDDALEEIIGKETLSRVRKRTLSKVSSGKPTPQTASSVKSVAAPTKTEQKVEKVSIRDFLKG